MSDQEQTISVDTVVGADVERERPLDEHGGSLRRVLEPLAIGIMVLGYLMIFQPFTIVLYSYSFTVILVGTIVYIIASHLPE